MRRSEIDGLWISGVENVWQAAIGMRIEYGGKREGCGMLSAVVITTPTQ